MVESGNYWKEKGTVEEKEGIRGTEKPFKGEVVWRCISIRDIQRWRRGLVPVRMATVMDEEENACNILEQQQ